MVLCYFGDMYLAVVAVGPGDAAEEVVDAQVGVADCRTEEADLPGLPPGGPAAGVAAAPVVAPEVVLVAAPVVAARRQQGVVD